MCICCENLIVRQEPLIKIRKAEFFIMTFFLDVWIFSQGFPNLYYNTH